MLLIDCGNSAIKCRLIQQAQISGQIPDQVFSLHQDKNLTRFSHYLGSVTTDKIFLASVSDLAITKIIIKIIENHTGILCTQVETLAEYCGLKNGYEDYKQLGVDRWLTLLAAIDQVKGDAFIIDLGSAITIDLLSKEQGHLGGAILPGFNTDKNRFQQIFSRIDFQHLKPHDLELPGRSTQSCININEIPATIKQINQILVKWQQLLEKPVNVLLCGQDAEMISRQLVLTNKVIPDLVFKGMLKQIQLAEK